MQRFFALHTERFMVFQLPSYSPDYHPIEKLWKNVKKEGTHLHYFPTFEALTDTLEHALLKFATTPAEILSLCSLPTEMTMRLKCAWPANLFLESYILSDEHESRKPPGTIVPSSSNRTTSAPTTRRQVASFL